MTAATLSDIVWPRLSGGPDTFGAWPLGWQGAEGHEGTGVAMFGEPVGVLAYLAGIGFVAGLARGFAGFGAALIFVPLAAAVLGPRVAAPVLLVIDSLGSLPMLPSAWQHGRQRSVLTVSLGALATVPIGAWALTVLDPVALRWAISLSILVLALLLASGWRYTGHGRPGLALLAGGASGLLNGTAQIGGPPIVVYWLGQRSITVAEARANIVLYFAYTTVWSAAVFAYAGLFSARVFLLSLAAGPAYLVGTVLGMRIFGLASAVLFRRVCYALITMAAILGMPVFR